MAAIGRFQFSPQAVMGGMNGATQVMPTGAPGYVIYYRIGEGSLPNSLGHSSGVGEGRDVGVIAYDFVNARWSCLFTSDNQGVAHANTTFENDKQEILDFMATLTAPNLVDEAGNDIPWPKSFIGTVG